MNSAGKSILITGGSGLIGSKLTAMLIEKGYQVSHLSRNKSLKTNVETFLWDPLNNYLDESALLQADHIIHLAGENIAAHRWTKTNKKIIVESRTLSADLLREKTSVYPNIKSVICASGIGIYSDQKDKWVVESSEQGTSFPAITCKQWEKANSQYACRTVILRTGLVLSIEGGALPELFKTKQFRILPYFGNGQFYQSWIHIEDLCRMYIYCIENSNIRGIYNAAAPNPVTNLALTKALRHAQQIFFFLIPVPKLLLRLILGEKSIIVTEGCRVSCEKIKKEGFHFIYNDIHSALINIFKNK